MRLAMALSTAVIGLVTGPYIYTHGLRAGFPLLFALLCAVIGTCMNEE